MSFIIAVLTRDYMTAWKQSQTFLHWKEQVDKKSEKWTFNSIKKSGKMENIYLLHVNSMWFI